MPARKATKTSTSKKQLDHGVVSEELTNEIVRVNAPRVPSKETARTVESMERVKARIEMFDKNQQAQLLSSIIKDYHMERFTFDTNSKGHPQALLTPVTESIDSFQDQVTENQNGIFLNLTTCSEALWRSCVWCVDELERQTYDLEKLDKERQLQMEQLKQRTGNCVMDS